MSQGVSVTTKGLVSDDNVGGRLATKGLVGGGTGPAPASPTRLIEPPGYDVKPGTSTYRDDTHTLVVVPTAINTCLMASENLSDNLRARQSSNLELPSMYKRAFLVAYETDEIALVRQ